METAPFREPRDGELVGGGGAVGEIQPQGNVSQSSVSAGGGEIENRNVETSGDSHRPAEEDVGDDAEGGLAVGGGDVGDEAADGELEGGGGLEQSGHLAEGKILGVLGVGGEAVVGAREMELREADGGGGGGGGGDGGAEVVDVGRGGGDGDGENRGSLENEIGEADEGDEMAVSHERKHQDVAAGIWFGAHRNPVAGEVLCLRRGETEL